MSMTDADLGTMLVEESYLSAEDLRNAQEQAQRQNVSLKTALFDLSLLTQDLFEGAVAEHFKLPFFDPKTAPPAPDVVAQLPEEIARAFRCAVVAREGDTVTVATSDPSQENLEEALRINIGQEDAALPEGAEPRKEQPKKKGLSFSFTRKQEAARQRFDGEIQLMYAPQTMIDSLLARYRKPLATRFQAIIEQQRKVAPEILEEIVNDAIELRASDIHFEPQEKEVLVRFRVDGVMHEAGRIPKEYYEGVVNRIKIAANMRIDEHFAAQDCAIRYAARAENLDIRVSIVPLVDGEKVCMRMLSAYVQ